MTKYPYASYVQMTVHLMHLSLMETTILYRERPQEEVKLVNSSLFQNYALSLQYMFTMEFAKLFEPSGESSKNVASLARWNKFLSDRYGEEYKERFDVNRKLLNEIRKSSIYKLILSNRNTKFAHIDSIVKNPYSISALSDNVLGEAVQLLDKIKEILQNLTLVDGYEFAFLHVDDRTDNFIRFHAVYEEFYHKNFRQAIAEGFQLF